MTSKPMHSQRLAPLQQLAQNREDEAARRVADSQRALERQEAQLSEMERYLTEYSVGTAGAGKPGATLAPALLANREAFLRQLAEALRWQAGAVNEARGRLELARSQWLDRHRDTGKVEHLLVRSQDSERRQHERRAQRELDEFAQRLPTPRPL